MVLDLCLYHNIYTIIGITDFPPNSKSDFCFLYISNFNFPVFLYFQLRFRIFWYPTPIFVLRFIKSGVYGNEVRESEKVRKGLTSEIRKSVKIRIWERKLIYYYLSIITYLLLLITINLFTITINLFNYNYI